MRRFLLAMTLCASPIAALTLVALSARPACACSAKAAAYRASMRSALMNLATAQELFREDSGRYAATIPELGGTGVLSSSADATIDSLIGTVGWTATARHEEVSTETCQMIYAGIDDPPPEPHCSLDAQRAATQLTLDLEFGIGLLAMLVAVATALTGHMHRAAAVATSAAWAFNPFAPGPLVPVCGDPSATLGGLLFTVAAVGLCAAGLALRWSRRMREAGR